MKKYLYSSDNLMKNNNKLFFTQIKNIWDIYEDDAKLLLNTDKIAFYPYSEKHFNILYKLIKNKMDKMNKEEKILYIEYRKKHFDMLYEKSSLKFLISFFIGGSFTGISTYFSNNILTNFSLLLAFLCLVSLYFLLQISPQKPFNMRLLSAIEKTTSNDN